MNKEFEIEQFCEQLKERGEIEVSTHTLENIAEPSQTIQSKNIDKMLDFEVTPHFLYQICDLKKFREVAHDIISFLGIENCF